MEFVQSSLFFSSSLKKCLISGILTKSMALLKLNWESLRPLSLQKDSSCLMHTVCCQVSGRYQYPDTWNKNSIFEAPFSVLGKRKCFEWKLNFSALRWKFWRVYSLRNSRRRRRSVQVSTLFKANIYAVYCAVKLVLLTKGLVICIFSKKQFYI